MVPTPESRGSARERRKVPTAAHYFTPFKQDQKRSNHSLHEEGTDMDVTQKAMASEYHKKVEAVPPAHEVTACVDLEELGVREIFSGHEKLKTPITETAPVKRKMRPINQRNQISPVLRRLALALCLTGLLSPAEGATVAPTRRPPPKECLSWIKINTCPARDHSPYDWEKMNAAYCGDDCGTVLHCQPATGQQTPIAACLPDQNVPPGHFARVADNDTGYPEVQIIPCETGTFEPQSRPSSSFLNPYCHNQKTSCDNEGEELLCLGGTTRDDRCRCAEGFQVKPLTSSCLAAEGYTKHSPCSCEPIDGAKGHQPAGNDSTTWPLPQCSELPADTGTGTVPPATPTTIKPHDNHSGTSADVITGVCIGIFLCLVLAALFGFWYRKHLPGLITNCCQKKSTQDAGGEAGVRFLPGNNVNRGDEIRIV